MSAAHKHGYHYGHGHLMHTNEVTAKAYIGRAGEITGVFKKDENGNYIATALVVHDGCTPGGVARMENSLPSIETEITVEAGEVALDHGLNRYPTVRVINEAGAEIDVPLVHTNRMQVMATFAEAGTYTLLIN